MKGRKILRNVICILGFLCGFACVFLIGCEARGLFSTPEAIKFSLLAAFWGSVCLTWNNLKFAKLYCVMAVGYGLLTIWALFF